MFDLRRKKQKKEKKLYFDLKTKKAIWSGKEKNKKKERRRTRIAFLKSNPPHHPCYNPEELQRWSFKKRHNHFGLISQWRQRYAAAQILKDVGERRKLETQFAVSNFRHRPFDLPSVLDATFGTPGSTSHQCAARTWHRLVGSEREKAHCYQEMDSKRFRWIMANKQGDNDVL